MSHGWLFFAVLCLLVLALPVGADAPPGRYKISSGTVHDMRTKLTWQQVVDSNGYAPAQAVTYCAGLPLAGGGWRVPRISELLTIVDVTKQAPTIDLTAFPGAPSDVFWSSSPSVATTGTWAVDFSTGFSTHLATFVYPVRCVR